ncbi:MAG: hypothetical protein F6K55_09920 [Moorea sp. SIO4A3]|nr:hypothetical protein [Moorena sp. SIO4A3]
MLGFILQPNLRLLHQISCATPVGCVRDGLALIFALASIGTVHPVTHHHVKQHALRCTHSEQRSADNKPLLKKLNSSRFYRMIFPLLPLLHCSLLPAPCSLKKMYLT